MYLFMCKSLTYAQRSARILEGKGIGASVNRSPREITTSGCGYCVRVADRNKDRSLELLNAALIPPLRLYHEGADGYTEVPL